MEKAKYKIYPALSGSNLARVYVFILKQALDDAHTVAAALRFEDDSVQRACHQKYTNSLTAKFSPERERLRLLQWLEGYQFTDICDFLDEDGDGLAKKIRDLLDG